MIAPKEQTLPQSDGWKHEDLDCAGSGVSEYLSKRNQLHFSAQAGRADGWENDTQRFSKLYDSPDFPQLSPRHAVAKRALDIVFSIVILALFLPLAMVIALAILLDSRGPVLFKQVRVGRGGRYFWCYKFRSMCVDSEKMKAALDSQNEMSGPVFKIKNDPRITRIGKILRKSSLDEVPQLFNVLLGDMSLVGPRPPLPSEVQQYNSLQKMRLSVLPGITCIWQVSGRNNLSFDEWVALDIKYIENMSMWLDLSLLLRTIPAVAFGVGAC